MRWPILLQDIKKKYQKNRTRKFEEWAESSGACMTLGKMWNYKIRSLKKWCQLCDFLETYYVKGQVKPVTELGGCVIIVHKMRPWNTAWAALWRYTWGDGENRSSASTGFPIAIGITCQSSTCMLVYLLHFINYTSSSSCIFLYLYHSFQ